MFRFVILFFALAPSLVLLQYGIAKARSRWGDALVWEAYFTGGIATLLAVLLGLLLKGALAIDAMSPLHWAATEALFRAAIPEELAKFAILFLVIKRYGGDTERHDMITLAFAVSLGFAAIENISYLLLPGDWHVVALGRAELSVPGHGLNGLAMGAFLTAARLSPHHRRLWLSASVVVPILMHAFFDFPLMLVVRNQNFGGVLPAWFLLQILITLGVLWWSNKMRTTADYDYHLPDGSGRLRLVGFSIVLCAPLFALVAFLQDGNSVIAAAMMLVMPSIFGIDLLWTRAKPTRVTSFRLAGGD